MRLARAVCAVGLASSMLAAQQPGRARAVEIDSGRFTFVAFPRDAELARSLLAGAMAHDSFPGLPRPEAHARVLLTPDAQHFRDAIGPSAPEWGAAIATPVDGQIVMQGSRANSSAGDPSQTLRHELAHLALHEALGDLPPRWFDEGYASYAAGEAGRDDVLATNVALALRGVPPLDSLDELFLGGEAEAQTGYALARSAVAAIAALDSQRGLSLFFRYWRDGHSMDRALRDAYGVTETDFEARWRAAGRRRYGALGLLADVTFAGGVLTLLVLPFWLIRRRRDRARLAQLVAMEEREERRARDEVLRALLQPDSQAPPDTGTKPGNENLIN